MWFTYRSIEIYAASLLLIVSLGSIAANVGSSTPGYYALDWDLANTTARTQLDLIASGAYLTTILTPLN